MYHSVIMLSAHFLVGCAPKNHNGVPSLMEARQEDSEVFWLPYRSWSIEEYRSQPQIIYATADWCLTCVQFEREILRHPSIQKSLLDGEFVAFRADWTQHDPDVSSLMEEYDVQLLPFLVIVKHGQTILLKEGVQREDLARAIAD